jgi:hypothetical protein
LLWQQIIRIPELVGSEKGISQRQFLSLVLGFSGRVQPDISNHFTKGIALLENDAAAFARTWSTDPLDARPGWFADFRYYRQSSSESLSDALRLVATTLCRKGELDAVTVQGAAHYLSLAIPSHAFPKGGKRRNRAFQREVVAQCDIARDVLGYPEVTVRFDSEWRTSTAVAIVRGMYESRDYSPMPILADALQDSGCDEPEILEHCRAESPHYRGCWVCEWLLGFHPAA